MGEPDRSITYSHSDTWCRGCLGRDLHLIGEKNGYALLRCNQCQTVIVDPYPTEDKLAEHYTDYHKNDSYGKKKQSKLRRARRRVKRMLREMRSGNKFLDVGCNLGYTAEAARELGLKAYGIDIDPVAIEIAKKSFPKTAGFEQITIEDMARRGDKFDLVYCSEVLEHVGGSEGFIEAVAKVMNPGAILYLTTPDAGHWRVPKSFSSWSMVCPPQHVTYFSREGLRRIFERHRLRILSFQLAMKPGIKVLAWKG